MKAFFDLQVGDKIYYYDKFKIHEQIIHDITLNKKQEERIDFWSKDKIIRTNYVLTIKAGKNSVIEISYCNKNPTELNINELNETYGVYEIMWRGMHRFSNFETALKYISKLRTIHMQKAYKFYKRWEKEENLISKYKI